MVRDITDILSEQIRQNTPPTVYKKVSTVSIGIAPRKGTLYSAAILSPPPRLKIYSTSPQQGQAKPLMFSTIPSTFTRSFLQKVNSRRIVDKETYTLSFIGEKES